LLKRAIAIGLSVVGARKTGGPLLSGALRAASARLRGLAELHRENLGKGPVVQTLLYRNITCAWPAGPRPGQPGALDRTVVAQRIKMEAHRGHMQAGLRSELDGINRTAVLTHHLMNAFPLAVARQAISPWMSSLSVGVRPHLSPSVLHI